MRPFLLILSGSFVLAAAGIAGAMWWVHHVAKGHVFTELAGVPPNDVAMVLGTSPLAPGGRHRNPHFDHRMTAAAALYRVKRVRHLILSGDNGTRGYDEPRSMQEALLALGVPADAMTIDDAGFRTLDSMARARNVFGQCRLTIVTDRFHCDRAVFLARAFGIDAAAFGSAEVELRYSLKSRLRECLADVKACLDLYVLHTRPKFLGKPIRIATGAARGAIGA